MTHPVQTCYDRHFTTCERCGAIIRENEAYYEGEDDDIPYCYDCHQRRRRERPIHDYYFKPEPIFHGDGLRYFGVELEIDGAGECNDTARQILRVADSEDEEYLYIKHDGSLDDGMELVTHPMTLAFHKSQMPWTAVLQKANELGYVSHQASTCGLHVHVNRDSLGGNEAEQDMAIPSAASKSPGSSAPWLLPVGCGEKMPPALLITTMESCFPAPKSKLITTLQYSW